MRKPFLPAWYLPNATIKTADENQLEAASSSCERWGIWCAALVVVSVAAEFVIALGHPAYDSTVEIWGTAIADFFVAIGIVGEVLFSIRDGRIQTALRKRSNGRLAEVEVSNGFLIEKAAEATERAAKAELETQELRTQFAWRRVSPEQFGPILVKLRGKLDEVNVYIESTEDPESVLFSFDLRKLFASINVRTISRRSTNMHIDSEPIFGLYISGLHGHAAFVIDALNSVGIAASTHALPIGDHVLRRAHGATMADFSLHPRLHVYVGHKPMA